MEIDATKLTSVQKMIIYGILGLLGLVYGSAIFAIAASAAMNIMVILGCTLALAGGFFAVPWLKFKMANYFLKKMKKEARENPIETLQNEFIERKKMLSIAKERLTKIIGLTNSSKERHEAFQRKYQETDPAMEKMLIVSAQVITKARGKISDAETKLREFEKTIERENDRYQMALASGELAAALKSAEGDENPMQSFLHNEALDGVRTEFSQSMAEIDSLLTDHEATLALPASQNVEKIEFTLNTQEEAVTRR